SCLGGIERGHAFCDSLRCPVQYHTEFLDGEWRRVRCAGPGCSILALLRDVDRDERKAPADGLAQIVDELAVKGVERCYDAESLRDDQIPVTLPLVREGHGDRCIGAEHREQLAKSAVDSGAVQLVDQ